MQRMHLPSACLHLDFAVSRLHLAVWLSPYAAGQNAVGRQACHSVLLRSACRLAYYKEWLAEFYALAVFY